MISIVRYLFETENLNKLVHDQTKDSKGRSDIKPRDIKPESHYYNDLGYDELDKFGLATEIHNNVVKMTDKQHKHFIKNIHTVGDTVDFIKKLKTNRK